MESLGVMSYAEARARADREGLFLEPFSRAPSPPVYRLMDPGAFATRRRDRVDLRVDERLTRFEFHRHVRSGARTLLSGKVVRLVAAPREQSPSTALAIADTMRKLAQSLAEFGEVTAWSPSLGERGSRLVLTPRTRPWRAAARPGPAEVRIRQRLVEDDLRYRVARIRRYLGDGRPVLLVCLERGPEVGDDARSEATLRRAAEAVADLAAPDGAPVRAGSRVTLRLVPRTPGMPEAP